MKTVAIIVCYFLTVIGYPTDSYEKIASFCCKSMKNCCIDRIKFGQSINCTTEVEKWKQPDIMMLQCIEQRLNKESQLTDSKLTRLNFKRLY
jgi:hypothetical protein